MEGYDFLKLQLGTEEAICRTCRSCYIAECYAADNNWAEAVSLADLAETLSAGGDPLLLITTNVIIIIIILLPIFVIII